MPTKTETVVTNLGNVFAIVTSRIEQQNRSILTCERPYREFRKAIKEKVNFSKYTLLSYEIISNRSPTVERRCVWIFALSIIALLLAGSIAGALAGALIETDTTSTISTVDSKIFPNFLPAILKNVILVGVISSPYAHQKQINYVFCLATLTTINTNSAITSQF